MVYTSLLSADETPKKCGHVAATTGRRNSIWVTTEKRFVRKTSPTTTTTPRPQWRNTRKWTAGDAEREVGNMRIYHHTLTNYKSWLFSSKYYVWNTNCLRRRRQLEHVLRLCQSYRRRQQKAPTHSTDSSWEIMRSLLVSAITFEFDLSSYLRWLVSNSRRHRTSIRERVCRALICSALNGVRWDAAGRKAEMKLNFFCIGFLLPFWLSLSARRFLFTYFDRND